MNQTETGLAINGSARLHCEVAGSGQPVVLLHAGVADSRQWNHEFVWLAERYRVVRHDLRGYGLSEPVVGDFSHLEDLQVVLRTVEITDPALVIGCSMGGTLAMDFALEHPTRVRGIVMVGAGPSGLKLDVPRPALFAAIDKASEAGDLDRVAELETRLWFDGAGRTPGEVEPQMRILAYTMNRLALQHEQRQLGKRIQDVAVTAVQRLQKLAVPVLSIVGEHDIPYIHLATDYLVQHVPTARKAVLQDAAHLPNMDQPSAFRLLVEEFTAAIDVGTIPTKRPQHGQHYQRDPAYVED